MRLAVRAADRIADGALDCLSVRALASELEVSERHLRRCMREVTGATPMDLAQVHRLLSAHRRLLDSRWDLSRIAYASGFQSLRRFNAAFKQWYDATPGDVRRGAVGRPTEVTPLTLELQYRGPLAWDALLLRLGGRTIPGVDRVDGSTYSTTVRIQGQSGFLLARNDRDGHRVQVSVSASLAPVLVPLTRRLRHLFDLDADPHEIDRVLAQGPLGPSVRERPGVRLPGSLDAFATAVAIIVLAGMPTWAESQAVLAEIPRQLGELVETGVPGLDRVMPAAEAIIDAGVLAVERLGVPHGTARELHHLARSVAEDGLILTPGADPREAARHLRGFLADERLVAEIVLHTTGWPDVFAAVDSEFQRLAGARGRWELHRLAEEWRPWRAYAAEHLLLQSPARRLGIRMRSAV